MKRTLVILTLLLVLITGVAADSLLLRSILSCTYDELSAMSRAYGLDSSLDESELRANLLLFFGLHQEEPENEEPVPAEISKAISIQIDHADKMYSKESVVVLSGGIRISFTTEDSGARRTLLADNVAIDLNEKILEASGSVSLSDDSDEDRTFSGQVIYLDWSNLDIIVFDGVSTTTKSNSDGTGILFHVNADSISYAGESQGIFMQQGTIATTEKDPYWSIRAQKLSISGNDMFVDRAVFRLGRVPILYLPVFFYPGTTLSFNPAIGLSSSKGAFLSSTYEVYGRYPRLGQLGTASGNRSGGDVDYTASISSFLKVSDKSDMIRDGFYYRPVEEGEDLGYLETWARRSGSYMAVFADTYQNLGLAVGLESVNYLLDRSLTLGAVGVAAYNPNVDKLKGGDYLQRFRYVFDFNANYRLDKLSVAVRLPVLSDPTVKVDYLNRNTAFALDALPGREQYFPGTYSSQSTYTWSVNANYSFDLGGYSFNISSLKSDIDYKLEKTIEDGIKMWKPKIVEASLPYLSFSSSGTFFKFEGKDTRQTKTLDYTNALAREFSAEMAGLEIAESSEPDGNLAGFEFYDGPEVKIEETDISQGGGIKTGYTFAQIMDNIFKDELGHDNYYIKLNGSFYVDAWSPGQWIQLTETIKPQFNHNMSNLGKTNEARIDESYLNSSLKVKSTKLGLTYSLSQKLYSNYSKVTGSSTYTTEKTFKWSKEHVTEHSLSFSKVVGNFTFGYFEQFKPLTEILKPSIRYAQTGFVASADFSLKRAENEDGFRKGEANLDLSYSNSFLFVSVANNYSFEKAEETPWKGYTLVQKASLTPVADLVFSESATFTEKLKGSKLSLGASYTINGDVVRFTGSTTMNYSGEEYEKDLLSLSLDASQNKLSFYKGRAGFEQSLKMSLNYNFQNPYRTSFTIGYTMNFAVAEFLDLAIGVNSANKSFSRYFQGGSFDISSMWEDIKRSFDFFGDGRRNTGFNLSSFKLSAVHYMRDWNLYVDASGKMDEAANGSYEWIPTVTVYLKWMAIPELKAEGSWNSKTKEWT